jgi:hypothetical protein
MDNYKEKLRTIGTLGEAIEFAIKEAGLTKAFVGASLKESSGNFSKLLNGKGRRLSIEQIISIITVVKNTVITDWINIRAHVDSLSPATDLELRQDRYERELAEIKAKLQYQEEKDQAFKEVLKSFLDKY